jgi:hypothetical protein
MSKKIDSGKRLEIENDGKVGKTVGGHVTRLAMAIMLLANMSSAVGVFCRRGSGPK